VVKCRPPDNRDPEPDEIAACAPFLRRQLEALDPALVVTLGRYSMGTFMPGARIGQAHGTLAPVDPATGARDALAFAMYHPAAALRSTEVERTSFRDAAAVPAALLKARERRDTNAQAAVRELAASVVSAPPVTEAPVIALPAPPSTAPRAASIELPVPSAAIAAEAAAAGDSAIPTDQLTLF